MVDAVLVEPVEVGNRIAVGAVVPRVLVRLIVATVDLDTLPEVLAVGIRLREIGRRQSLAGAGDLALDCRLEDEIAREGADDLEELHRVIS